MPKPNKPTAPQGPTLGRHRHWLERAEKEAIKPLKRGGSPHPTVKVGAVLVDRAGKMIAAASNRFAHGVDAHRPERYRDGVKSLWINCAEQLALAAALKRRSNLKGATLYVTLEPCAICAGLLAEVGLKKIVVPVNSMRRYAKLKTKWKKSIEIGLIKLAEAGVRVTSIESERREKLPLQKPKP